jgi:hypothetical protein
MQLRKKKHNHTIQANTKRIEKESLDHICEAIVGSLDKSITFEKHKETQISSCVTIPYPSNLFADAKKESVHVRDEIEEVEANRDGKHVNLFIFWETSIPLHDGNQSLSFNKLRAYLHMASV